jgi:hypothetical protein
MDFQVFMPAAIAASVSFAASFTLLFLLIRRWSDRIWAFGVTSFLAVLVYVAVTGFTFGEYAHHYLPDYLWKLFF